MLIKRGDIYYIQLKGEGSEYKKERPCIVVSQNYYNKNSKTVIVVPTSSKKPKKPLETIYKMSKSNMPEQSWAHGEQIRSILKTNIGDKICVIHKEDMYGVEKCVKKQIFESYRLTNLVKENLLPSHARGEIYKLEGKTKVGDPIFTHFLLLSNDVGNHFSPIVTGVPIVSVQLPNEKNEIRIPQRFWTLDYSGYLRMDYIKSVSKNRLKERVGIITAGYYQSIEAELKWFLGID